MCKNTKQISTFDNFITEGMIAQLLLEGNLMASDNFLQRLSNISSNKIASDLYNAFSYKVLVDKSLAQNWVDVTNKEDAVTFMSDRSAERFSNPEEIFAAKNRNEIKIGRLARAVLNEIGKPASDKDMEIFVNIYKSSNVDNSKKFELISGANIKKYYAKNSYAETKGTLGGSCMQHDECQQYFKIYTKNPEACRLLVYLNERGQVLGRALVWRISTKELYNIDETPYECESEYFMDRVYTCNDSDIIKFINYAKKENWLYKYKMTSDEQNGLVFKYNDKSIFGRIVVKLNRLHFNKYPFVDTLAFANGDSMISNVGFTINEEDDDYDEGFLMGSTDGSKDVCDECDGTGYDKDDGTECSKCNGDGDVDCPICKGSSDIYCIDCKGEGELECSDCEGGGQVDCSSCGGMGSNECNSCDRGGRVECKDCKGEGNTGNCKKCEGEGNYVCKKCKGEDVICVTCDGEGIYSRKWGKGTRTVTCSDCGGYGKGSSGTVSERGCICNECVVISRYTYGQPQGSWSNKGYVECSECDGEGTSECVKCDGEGKVMCDKCDGEGEIDCDDCEFGTIECKKCKGKGNLGTCKKCKGEGNLGECTSCNDGQIKCVTCSGTGEKVKGVKDLCSQCSGILDELKSDLRSNEFKIN